MTTCVGLTDDPDRRRTEHGSPSDWRVVRSFAAEVQARAWEGQFANAPGYRAGTGGSGWRYGYAYTITQRTKQ